MFVVCACRPIARATGRDDPGNAIRHPAIPATARERKDRPTRHAFLVDGV